MPLGWLAYLLLVGGSPATGAPSTTDELMDDVESQLNRLDDSLDSLQADFSQRKGLIGGGEARNRYEDGVFSFLLGEYDEAAYTFFTLVESGSLVSPELRADAEWYLGESLFELKNYGLATENYQSIITQGSRHPFFEDAVLRQLELYAIIEDPEAFYSIYNRFILTNKVQATDQVRYTLAKSFYRQGDLLRAKSMFNEIQADSSYYGKARYVLGIVLVAEQNYDAAIHEFARAAEISVDDDDSQEIVDLAHLALGRLYYETGDLVSSSQFYQRLGRDSEYFSDALYEMVWTFIKQEDFTEAMRAVEIFLLAFPEHQKTAQLKVIQGHLHMKLEQYETALNTYERVITEYTPIQHQLMQIAQDPIEPEKWFERLSALDPDETYETDEVPTYTVEMLLRDDKFNRVRTSVKELEKQQEGVEFAEILLDEIVTSISTLDHLGNYQRARAKLGFLESELLRAQNELLAAEESWLLEYADARALSMIGRLQQQRESLASGTASFQAESSTQDEKGDAYEDQVRGVQNYASRIEQEVRAAQEEAEALERMLDSGGGRLSEGQAKDARRRLATVRQELDDQVEELRRLQSDSTRGQVLSTVRAAASPQAQEQSLSDLSGGYRVLRSQYGKLLVSYIGQDREGFIERVKSAWSRVDGIQTGANQVYTALRSQESTEMAVVREKIEAQKTLVSDARGGVDDGGSRGDQLAVDITRLGFRELEELFSDKVLEADIGIVDVYWTRKVDVGTELESLSKEQQALLRELNSRFSNVMRGIE